MDFTGTTATETWTVDDVDYCAGKMGLELTDLEKRFVLSLLPQYFDPSVGMNWSVIQQVIGIMKQDGQVSEELVAQRIDPK